MRHTLTIAFILASNTIFAQFGIRASAGAEYIFDNDYYQTTVDLNGLKAVTMGTADNLVNIGQDLRDLFGQNYAAIFKGDLPEVVKEGSTTYYKYNDKLITEQLKQVRETSAQIGAEAGYFGKPVVVAIGVRNSKYRYFAPDFYGMAYVRPWEVFAAARGIISPFDHPEQFYDKLLSVFHIGYMAGNDFGMPGFLNFGQKDYQGILFGISPTINKFTIQFQGFLQTKHKPDLINQSNFTAVVSYLF